MNSDNYFRKNELYSKIFIAIGCIGILALVLSYVVNVWQNSALVGIFSGLAFGFAPTGIGMLIIIRKTRNNPRMIKNVELETEERNVFINTKSACTAFWITYLFIFVLVMTSNIVSLSLKQFSILTLIFMPVVYFLIVIINHKRY